MLKGKAILEDAAALGVATETAVFKHLFARYHAQNAHSGTASVLLDGGGAAVGERHVWSRRMSRQHRRRPPGRLRTTCPPD